MILLKWCWISGSLQLFHKHRDKYKVSHFFVLYKHQSHYNYDVTCSHGLILRLKRLGCVCWIGLLKVRVNIEQATLSIRPCNNQSDHF
jgi:hypothetical protein